MSTVTTYYLITIGEPDIEGIMADNAEEAFIFVGRCIERFCNDANLSGKYIYVEELKNKNGTYMRQDGLFKQKYLIEP